MTKKINEDIVVWHTETFPDVTFASELLKLEEELREFNDCKEAGKDTEAAEELADVYIVSSVLKSRFNSAIGRYFVKLLETYPSEETMELVKKKMKVNKKRNWKFKEGVYRHEN